MEHILRPSPDNKMFIHNLEANPADDETVVAQFNPTQLQESIDVMYNRVPIIGMSHEPMQYLRTGNYKIPLELFFNIRIPPTRSDMYTTSSTQNTERGPRESTVTTPGLVPTSSSVITNPKMPELNQSFTDPNQLLYDKHQRFRALLMSWCYPDKSDTIGGGGPPRLLFVWPFYISIVGFITNLQITVEQFTVEGQPAVWRCNLELEETRDTRLFRSDLRDQGTLRGDIA